MKMRNKILVVDDDTDNLKIVEKILGNAYDLKTATTGREALEIAPDFQPDVILLDIMMPGMNGYEVCRRLREYSTLSDTTIIMVTAKGTLPERVRGHNVGADDYIVKPFEEKDLLGSVRFFLQKDASHSIDIQGDSIA